MGREINAGSRFFMRIPVPACGKVWKVNPKCPEWVRKMVVRIEADQLERLRYQF